MFESPSSLPCGLSPIYMLGSGTYYMWAKRASVPSGANLHYVHALQLR